MYSQWVHMLVTVTPQILNNGLLVIIALDDQPTPESTQTTPEADSQKHHILAVVQWEWCPYRNDYIAASQQPILMAIKGGDIQGKL